MHTPSTPLSLFHFLLLIQENSNIALIKLSLFQALSRAAECGWEKTHRCAAGPDFTFLMSSGLFHCLIIKLHLLGLFTFCYSRWLLRAFSVIFKPQPLYPLPPKFTVSWWWSCILYTEKKKKFTHCGKQDLSNIALWLCKLLFKHFLSQVWLPISAIQLIWAKIIYFSTFSNVVLLK